MTSLRVRTNAAKNVRVSATRWQHGSCICFSTFVQKKITKMPITQQPLTLEKMSKILEFCEEKNDIGV
jgi:hypothetical protein